MTKRRYSKFKNGVGELIDYENESICIPRQYSLIRFTKDTINFEGFDMSSLSYHKDNKLVYLGEIPNIPEHCIILDITLNKHIIGIHIDNIEEIPEDDVFISTLIFNE